MISTGNRWNGAHSFRHGGMEWIFSLVPALFADLYFEHGMGPRFQVSQKVCGSIGIDCYCSTPVWFQ